LREQDLEHSLFFLRHDTVREGFDVFTADEFLLAGESQGLDEHCVFAVSGEGLHFVLGDEFDFVGFYLHCGFVFLWDEHPGLN
jgi:hypothetical protein